MAYTTIDNPELYFQTKLYTGNGGTNALTLDGSENMQPDWVWIKNRNGTQDHHLFDSVRGTLKRLESNSNTNEETRASSLTSYDSDGFTLGTYANTNTNNDTYVAWNWKAGGSSTSTNSDGDISGTQTVNQTAGFSITTYNGNGGSNQSLGHGLGATPKVYICKRRDNTGQWLVMNTLTDGTLDYLFLETNGAKSNSSQTLPTSSIVYLQNGGDANESGGTHVMYAFAEKKGFSKFGTHVGNGNADGTFVYTGFKPAFVISKRYDSSGNWTMHDNKRNSYNGQYNTLFPNLTNADIASSARSMNFFSNGFKFAGTDEGNVSGEEYIHIAFAESPFVTSTGIPTTAR